MAGQYFSHLGCFIIWYYCYLSVFGLWSFLSSLSSADKMEEGKNMFKCQIHMWQTPLKWLWFLIHENKLLLNLVWLTTQISNNYFFIHRQFFFSSTCFLSVLAALYYLTKECKNSCWLSTYWNRLCVGQ